MMMMMMKMMRISVIIENAWVDMLLDRRTGKAEIVETDRDVNRERGGRQPSVGSIVFRREISVLKSFSSSTLRRSSTFLRVSFPLYPESYDFQLPIARVNDFKSFLF